MKQKYSHQNAQAPDTISPEDALVLENNRLKAEIEALKANEKLLKETAERLRLVLAISPDLICFKDGEERWLEANDAALRMVGLTGVDYRGLTDADLGPYSPFYQGVFDACAKSDAETWLAGGAVRSEETLPMPDGGELVLDQYKIPIFDPDGRRKHLLVLGRDITAKKRAEIELQRSHDQLETRVKARTAELEAANASLQALGDNLPNVAIYQFERSGTDLGRYTYVSRGFERIRGLSLAELVNDGALMESIHPEDVTRFRQAEERSAQDLSIFDFEGRVNMPTGELKWVRWRAAPRRLENGNILWEGFMTDVTSRKLAEAALHDAHQSLRVIKECGAAIARASSEEELLKNICQTILKIGDICLAWVGYPELDAKKSVRPVAHAGKDAAYIGTLNISWSDCPSGHGPTGTAIRTRRTTIFSDLQADPRFATWAVGARTRGYGCIISLPLMAGKNCIGALSICSSQNDAFNPEKVELLEQLARDISHGILALRTRAEREQLEKELLRISEREKQLIAQELHDGLCQHLAGASLMGTLLQRRLVEEGSKEAEYAKEICALLATGLAEARNLSHGLHPIKEAGEGLMEALSQLAQTATRLFHTPCSFVFDEEAVVEDPVAVTHLFRIAQEALTNTMKHGEATQVMLSLRKSGDWIALSIQDNGVGISEEPPRGRGLGLELMKHRAQSIGATLEIGRAGETGTRVLCKLPVSGH